MPFSCCFWFKWGLHARNYSYSIPLSISTSVTAASAGDECSSTRLQLRGLLGHRHIKPSESKRRGRGTKMFSETMKAEIGLRAKKGARRRQRLDQRQRQQQQQQRACE